MNNLEEIAEKIRSVFDQKTEAREEGLKVSREIIRAASLAIRAIHRGEFDRAEELIRGGRDMVKRARAVLLSHPDVFYAGFIHNSEKEYAEANITYALIKGTDIPSPEELEVDYPAYLNGMGEAVGEMRRHLLDKLRRGEIEYCETLLGKMDDIYSVLVTMDYADALTGGLRRTTDMVRGVLEKTRGDLTITSRQQELEATLQEFEKKLGSSALSRLK